MSAHAGVIPIGNIDRSVRSYDNVGRAEEDLGIVRVSATANEVRTCVLLVRVGGGEVALLEFEGRALGFGLVVEDGVFAGFAGKEGSIIAFGERSVFIHGDSGRRAAAIDVPDVHGAGVVLTPVGTTVVLAGAFDGAVTLFGIAGEVAGASVFKNVGNTACRWIVVVVLESVAEGVERLLVGIAVAVADDFGVGAVGVHAHGEAGGPNVSVVRAFAGDSEVISRPFAAAAFVGAAHVEILAGVVFKNSAAVAVVEVEFSVRPTCDRVEGVIVVFGIEAGQEDFAFVDGGVKFEVTIDVGVNEEFGWLGDVNDVVKNGDAERGDESFFLHEGVGGVGFAIAIGVLHDRDAVTAGAASVVAAIVDAFGNPHASGVVEVNIGGIVKVGRSGPNCDFEIFGELELGEVDERMIDFGFPRGVGILGGADDELNGGFGDLALLFGAAVIESDLGREFDSSLRNFQLNERLGVGAQALLVGFAIDGKRTSPD